jgi:hypothetical protein
MFSAVGCRSGVGQAVGGTRGARIRRRSLRRATRVDSSKCVLILARTPTSRFTALMRVPGLPHGREERVAVADGGGSGGGVAWAQAQASGITVRR